MELIAGVHYMESSLKVKAGREFRSSLQQRHITENGELELGREFS